MADSRDVTLGWADGAGVTALLVAGVEYSLSELMLVLEVVAFETESAVVVREALGGLPRGLGEAEILTAMLD